MPAPRPPLARMERPDPPSRARRARLRSRSICSGSGEPASASGSAGSCGGGTKGSALAIPDRTASMPSARRTSSQSTSAPGKPGRAIRTSRCWWCLRAKSRAAFSPALKARSASGLLFVPIRRHRHLAVRRPRPEGPHAAGRQSSRKRHFAGLQLSLVCQGECRRSLWAFCQDQMRCGRRDRPTATAQPAALAPRGSLADFLASRCWPSGATPRSALPSPSALT